MTKKKAEQPWVTGSFPPEWSYTRLPNSMLLDPTITPEAKVLWMLLCHLAYEQQTARPVVGVAEARALIGMSVRTWNRTRDELSAAGLLVVGSRRGFARPNTYEVRFSGQNATMGRLKTHDPDQAETHDPYLEDLKTESLASQASPGQALESAESKPPKLVKIDGRNLGMDALAEVCGIDPSGNQAGRLVAALNGGKAIKVGIRTLCWREWSALDIRTSDPSAFEEFVAGRIRDQAKTYTDTMNGAMLTPTALATWWTDMHAQPKPYNAMAHLREMREGGR